LGAATGGWIAGSGQNAGVIRAYEFIESLETEPIGQ
jgi:hypothetical protein